MPKERPVRSTSRATFERENCSAKPPLATSLLIIFDKNSKSNNQPMTRMLIEPREVPPANGLTFDPIKHLSFLKTLAKVAELSASHAFGFGPISSYRSNSRDTE
jgi:hypothetical protein